MYTTIFLCVTDYKTAFATRFSRQGYIQSVKMGEAAPVYSYALDH